MKTKLSISISAEAADYLKDLAQAEDRSISWLVNRFVMDSKEASENIKKKGGKK